MSGLTCGPFICDYPEALGVRRGTRWACPTCGTEYEMTSRWRNGAGVEHGYWRLAHPIRWHLHAIRTGRAT